MNNDFGKLKRKIFLWAILTTLVALIVGFTLQYIFIDGILQAPFANGFIAFCERFLRIDEKQSFNIYQHLFRNYKHIWLGIGFLIILFIIFYNSLTRFTRYFDEVSIAVNKLMDESKSEISLPVEIDFMAKRLNTVKLALEKRAHDAKEAEMRKNDLVVYLAHDIRTPLTSIIGYLSLINEVPEMPENQRIKYVNITLDKAYRLEMLINEFFEITRFNLQKIVLNKEKINLNQMLAQVADEFYPILSKQSKKIKIEIEYEMIIFADSNRLARVFNNVLKNAAYYSYDNSTIIIRAYKDEKLATITFSNEGMVIPQDKLNTIFEKFYRLDASRSTDSGGSGLGLAISKEIIKAHNGTILAESHDNITTFIVNLPL